MTREEREKAIDLLDNLVGMIEDNQDNDYDFALKKCIEALKQEPRWISSDTPPRRTMRVLVDYEITRYMGVKRSIRDVGIGCYCNGWYIENHDGEKIEMKIHRWMPLPKSEVEE